MMQKKTGLTVAQQLGAKKEEIFAGHSAMLAREIEETEKFLAQLKSKAPPATTLDLENTPDTSAQFNIL